jgi:uncharacterized membrane protein YsdA (DUF1294 family)
VKGLLEPDGVDTALVVSVVVAMNVATFLLFGWDKRCATRRRRRVPELWLLVPSALTGCLGAWIATEVFRHKTRKTSFRLKLAAATALNALWVWLAVG